MTKNVFQLEEVTIPSENIVKETQYTYDMRMDR